MNEPNIDPDTDLPVLVKQPTEDRLFSMQLTNLLVGETLSSVTSVSSANQDKVTNSENVTVGAGGIVGDAVEFRISGGTAGENYKITVEFTDSGDNTLEGEGMLYVRDH